MIAKIFLTVMVALILLLVSTFSFAEIKRIDVPIKNASKYCGTLKAVCFGVTESRPYRDIFKFEGKDFEKFKEINNLPKDTTLDSIAPAYTAFSTKGI